MKYHCFRCLVSIHPSLAGASDNSPFNDQLGRPLKLVTYKQAKGLSILFDIVIFHM